MCVKRRWRRRGGGGGGGGGETGIQNQKQEPHTKMWGMRRSRRSAAFLMLSSLKNEEVSQNCFVFDVVKFKNRGSLAELLRF